MTEWMARGRCRFDVLGLGMLTELFERIWVYHELGWNWGALAHGCTSCLYFERVA